MLSALLALLVVAGLSGCAGTDVVPATWELREPATADSETLLISVLGGGCHASTETIHRIDVDESSDAVTIAAFIRKQGTLGTRACPAVGTSHPADVSLEAPLGDRMLVDPACSDREHRIECKGTKRNPT